jgi:PAS domain S-box-containing protein
MTRNSKSSITLSRWIWISYLKTAIIPLIVVEAVFIILFFLSDSWMQREMSRFLKTEVDGQLGQIADNESTIIQNQLGDIVLDCALYARQTALALATTSPLDQAEADRLAYSPDGVYYTTKDSGGAAVFYSGYVPVGETERQKVANVLVTQHLMKDILDTHPLVASLYLNTWDSLNVIYPYFDVISQYATHMNIPSYNFYYEADAAHNPDGTVKWTDVYLDPAGHGWMASCIAPVYNGDFLEGVVGLDITVSTMTRQILEMDVPWDGYGILVGRDGTILALPGQGEEEWGLTELTEHHYDQAILQDTFKPEQFNLYKRADTTELAESLITSPNGRSTITLGGEEKVVAWDTIKETGWKLILIIPEQNIYAKIGEVGGKLQKLGLLMISGIILFYSVFFYVLYARSKKMSRALSQPLLALNTAVGRIGAGDYYQEIEDSSVRELQETAQNVVKMGRQLGEINGNLLTAQEELKEKEAYLQAVIHSIDDAIVELDENGVITNMFINDKNNTPARMTTASIDGIFERNRAELLLQVLKTVAESGKSETIETDIETVGGIRWAQARLSLISSDPVRVVVTARDITERREMESSISKARDEAEAASRAKSQFLSNMSHELRTPLNAVLGFAQVLDMDPSAPLTGMQKECVFEILKAGSHLLELINEVLDLARIEAGKARLSIEPVDVGTVVEETMTMILPASEKYGISVDADMSSCGSMYIRADKTKLKQIFINLLSNAIKYNKPGGKVEFYCEGAGDKVRFHVVDTGIGIPQTELEAIFKPFHRLGSTKNLVEGTGVGLAVVKQLAEMMGGGIHVESTEGKGSHFTVELQAAEEMTLWGEKGELKEQISIDNRAIGSDKKILYIEDNQANLRLVERVLELAQGATFLSAQAAEPGIEIARREKPDVILLDINLPGMDGYEAFEMLQTYEETKDIPIIAVSSNAMEREIGRAMRMGFFDYITKPIKADVFFERIKRVLNREQK